ncbi:Crp/Fnr family transcriptional regulator [Mucilaginibacter sp.]|jgi:CRP-like cAMP-binding protein|uniref:Crp/Fnr family transcriptional regulator n=1 Tax=Mucilaginibacter sp. TaxID=1882438 RepID=UPI00374D9FB7
MMSIILRQHFEQLITLNDAEFDYLLSHFSFKKVKRRRILLERGDPVNNDYFVLSGCLKAYTVNDLGKEHILQFAFKDWWISDYQSYYKGTPAQLYIDCIDDAEVLSLTIANREKLCREFHKIEYFFRKKSNFGYIALQNRILSLLNNNVRERYEQLILLYPDLLEKVPKQQVASYLGITRETLSRLTAPAK